MDFVGIPWRFSTLPIILPHRKTWCLVHEAWSFMSKAGEQWRWSVKRIKEKIWTENQCGNIIQYISLVLCIWIRFYSSFIWLEHHVERKQISCIATEAGVFWEGRLMRSQTSYKMWAVKKLDEDVMQLSSHDGYLYHFLNYSLWPSDGADNLFSTSQCSDNRFSHYTCYNVVHNQSWGHEYDLCQGKCWQDPVTCRNTERPVGSKDQC